MNILFMASPRAKKVYGKEITKIYELIEKMGHKHVNDFIKEVQADTLYKYSDKEVIAHYNRTMKSVKKADIAIVEVSVVSMSMGYIIDRIVEYSKPVVILYTDGKTPFFFSGINNDKVQVVEYDLRSIERVLEDSINYAAEQQDTRFNFFISPKHQNYLDWISKKRKLPRAVFLRRLIEEEMASDEEYNS